MKRKLVMVAYLSVAIAGYASGANLLLRNYLEAAGVSWTMMVLSMGLAGWFSQ